MKMFFILNDLIFFIIMKKSSFKARWLEFSSFLWNFFSLEFTLEYQSFFIKHICQKHTAQDVLHHC